MIWFATRWGQSKTGWGSLDVYSESSTLLFCVFTVLALHTRLMSVVVSLACWYGFGGDSVGLFVDMRFCIHYKIVCFWWSVV